MKFRNASLALSFCTIAVYGFDVDGIIERLKDVSFRKVVNSLPSFGWDMKAQHGDSLMALINAPYKPTYTSSPDLGGKCLIQDFSIDEQHPLGSGKFSIVYKAVHKPTNKTVAIKCYRYILGIIQNEEVIQHDLQSPYITKVYCSMKKDDQVYLVMEYFAKGDLRHYISTGNHLSHFEVARAIAQLLDVLHTLHHDGIAHLDVKPENILLDDQSNVKLTDLGVCHRTTADDILIEGLHGTPLYIAPEGLRGGPFGRPADYFAAGVTAFFLFTNMKIDPYLLPNKDHVWRNKYALQDFAEHGIAFPSTGSSDADELIKILIAFDPKERWDKVYSDFEQLKKMPIFAGTHFNPNAWTRKQKMAAIAIGVAATGIFAAVAYFVYRHQSRKHKEIAAKHVYV